ncbi:hypothetical protein [Microbulbifer halophilus]|uniref:Tse2 ADP-ribosyltransferase toxin domain-containing protein n=1 Tax=Microbulbifer halophilus TaxID=453963 RepID=A0ABW5EC56_9GAMM|nr:hypothetical protein [Microbulbifer halophilus]MCW8126621.1 hypothetical protein [Microbulbifer halophilus]
MNSENLYISKEDLYRLGNSTSSRLSAVRPREINTITVNDVEVIVADGNGVSLFNRAGLEKSPLSGWVWEIRSGTTFPPGLKLVERGSKGHHMLAPTHNMPLNQYIGLLEQVAIQCRKVFKRQA